ncbi:MAG TPA: hypothetical protein VH637_03805 [Streptosporangiaceae bacterium]|jgi:hypothetical protein
MIGRLFWLTLGAVAGVTGYRRLSRLLRAALPVPRRGRARESGGLASFARDVRDGMAQYQDQRAAPGRGHPGTDYAKDGR